jgi:hypothetical protein
MPASRESLGHGLPGGDEKRVAAEGGNRNGHRQPGERLVQRQVQAQSGHGRQRQPDSGRPAHPPDRRDGAWPQPGRQAAAEYQRPCRCPPEPERRRVQAPLVCGPRHRPVQRKRDGRPHNQGSSDRDRRPFLPGSARRCGEGRQRPSPGLPRPRLEPGRTGDAQTGGSPISPGLWRWPLHVAAPPSLRCGSSASIPVGHGSCPLMASRSPGPPWPRTGTSLNRLC